MRTFSLAEALIYLNTILPGRAPTSEITLRRAIRDKKLKAEVSIGRNGTKILEEDLIEFGKTYQKPHAATEQIAENTRLINAVMPDIQLMSIPKLKDLMTAFGNRMSTDKTSYKIELLTTRDLWMERRSALQQHMSLLSDELQKCQNEIGTLDTELKKI